MPNQNYIVASVSHTALETFIFQSDEYGTIVDWCEIGGVCGRHGEPNWDDHESAVNRIMKDKYVLIDIIQKGDIAIHYLYQKR